MAGKLEPQCNSVGYDANSLQPPSVGPLRVPFSKAAPPLNAASDIQGVRLVFIRAYQPPPMRIISARPHNEHRSASKVIGRGNEERRF
jgi:hypothetical protein